jgi:hypothetical protein
VVDGSLRLCRGKPATFEPIVPPYTTPVESVVGYGLQQTGSSNSNRKESKSVH